MLIKKFEKKKESREENDSKPKSWGSFFLELLKIVIISLAIIIPVRYYLIQPFVVRGSSMEPNFSNGEYLIIDELSYRFQEPERGDVVIFKYPKDTSQYYIKRIIGLPGETVEISSGEIIIYNDEHPEGKILKEPYFALGDKWTTPGEMRVTISYNEYFVLGDNRRASSDSRVWGLLPKEDIVGKVWIRGWPFDKIGVFKTPVYEFE